MLPEVSGFSVWNGQITTSRIGYSNNLADSSPALSSSALKEKRDDASSDYYGFNAKLRKAYDEWTETYGDSIDESRMEIFSYHFVMAENYYKETGNRIKLNEYADLTAVEFQRVKEMGGMIQDVKDSSNPHWAPNDAAEMDFFAKQTSQRQQAFQDNQNLEPDLPTPPPGYYSALPSPEDNASPIPGQTTSDSSTTTAAQNEGATSYRSEYQQRFTQSYLDSLNTQAKAAEDVASTQPLSKDASPESSDNLYMFEMGKNGKIPPPPPAEQQPPPNDSFQSASIIEEMEPELQDLINSRYDGIGFLEDSANAMPPVDDSFKFFPALSKMYNLDYPEADSNIPPPSSQQMDFSNNNLPPPPLQQMPPMMDQSMPSPMPNINNGGADKKETFMNAMATLYSQMFGEENGAPPPDSEEAFRMMQDLMNSQGGGSPALSDLYSNMNNAPPIQQEEEPQWINVPPEHEEKRPIEPTGFRRAEREATPPPQRRRQQQQQDIGTDVFLGELSYKMTRGRVIEWLKNVGDPVRRGEPLCVIESDTFMIVDGQKYAETHDVVALEDGILAAVYCSVTETVPVGSMLGVIAENEAQAARVPQTIEQENLDFVEPSGANDYEQEYQYDENGYPVDEEGYLIEDITVDEDGYPLEDYEYDENGYAVDEESYAGDDYRYDENGGPVDDYGYDENGYDAGYDEGGAADDVYGAESAYVPPADDDPDLPSWVLGNAPSIAPAKVASKYPVIPKMDRPQAAVSAPKQSPKRAGPKRGGPKGRPRGRIDDTRSPARKRRPPPRKEKIEGTEITLSELANGMTKGTIIEWIKGVGEPVTRGEPLAVVESDTFMMVDGQKYAESHDVIASEDGILAAIYSGIKQTMPVGSLLGFIAESEAAARNIPQSNPYENAGTNSYEEPENSPLSRTQMMAAAAAKASVDPAHRVRAAEAGFIDSVEQLEEDVLQQQTEQNSQQSDDFDRRFMTPEELQNADFEAAGGYSGGGGGPEMTYSPPRDDGRDLPSWVLGNAPSIAPAKVASKFPVVPKISQPPTRNSPAMNAIDAARNAALQNEASNTMSQAGINPPKRRGAPPKRNAPPPKRRRAPPKRRGPPPKRRTDDTRASGRGRIDDTRAPLNPPADVEEEGTEIVLGELSYGMTKGMVIEWLKNVGDPVRKGDPLAVVESDTFMMIDTQKYAESHDILATEDGFLAAQFAGPKELLSVGSVLGVIAESVSTGTNTYQPNGNFDRSSYDASTIEDRSDPSETYVPPPDPTEEADTPAWADDPDLPSWVRGNAPSIAPAKVASKYPVIGNARGGSPNPTPATSSQNARAVTGMPPARRIPKGRYDDTRARPREIRIEDKSKRSRPRGRIDDIRAPWTSQSSGATKGSTTYSTPEPQFFPDLSSPEKSGSSGGPDTNIDNQETSSNSEKEPRQYMPDLSKKKENKKSRPPLEDTETDPVAEVETNADLQDTDEELQPEESPVDIETDTSEGIGTDLPEASDSESIDSPSTDIPEYTETDTIAEDDTNADLLETTEEENQMLVPDVEANEDKSEEIQSDAASAEEDIDVEQLMWKEEIDADLLESTEEEDQKLEPDNSELGADELVSVDAEASGDMSEEIQSDTASTEEDVDVELSSSVEIDEGGETPEEIEMEAETGEAGDAVEVIGEPVDSNITASEEPKESDPEEVISSKSSAKKTSPNPIVAEIDVQEVAANSTSEAMVQEILITAKARTAAEEANIDLTLIQGTGESGCITLDDVKLAIARKKPKVGIRFLTDKPNTRKPSSKEKSEKDRP
jgi:pyruvate/2-oxoglutarate dehydrogenase complex dihydrolipoamide acyltransferase (E2) component